MKKQLLILMSLLCVSFNAHSIVELRAGYGVQTPSEDQVGTDTLKSFAGFNLDAIVELPMIPFGLGLRYETLGNSVNIQGLGDIDATFERTSLLINYRFIDLFLYAGAIATLGFTNDFTVEVPGSSVKYDASMTYSVGAEAGVSLGLMMIGAELGYIAANMSSTGNADADLSGIYAKALVGVGF